MKVRIPTVNVFVFAGRLTKDPVVKHFDSGSVCIRFSVAHDRYYKKNTEWVTETSFFNVNAFGSLATNMSTKLKKGDPVLIEGSIYNRSLETNGERKYYTEVNAKKISMLEKEETQKIEKNIDPDDPFANIGF